MPSRTVTELLRAWSAGEAAAQDELLPLVYRDLRLRAARYLRRERSGHSLDTADLVHEAYLRLVDQRVEWQNRGHFFAIAAQAIRRILVDHDRRRRAAKRGDPRLRVTFDETLAVLAPGKVDLVGLDEALNELAALDPQQSRIVVLRFFGGLSGEEVATVLGISGSTVKRDWRLARAWLRRKMQQE